VSEHPVAAVVAAAGAGVAGGVATAARAAGAVSKSGSAALEAAPAAVAAGGEGLSTTTSKQPEAAGPDLQRGAAAVEAAVCRWVSDYPRSVSLAAATCHALGALARAGLGVPHACMGKESHVSSAAAAPTSEHLSGGSGGGGSGGVGDSGGGGGSGSGSGSGGGSGSSGGGSSGDTGSGRQTTDQCVLAMLERHIGVPAIQAHGLWALRQRLKLRHQRGWGVREGDDIWSGVAAAAAAAVGTDG
jgi:hypothetical protein